VKNAMLKSSALVFLTDNKYGISDKPQTLHTTHSKEGEIKFLMLHKNGEMITNLPATKKKALV
jgi:hypothetical protein